MKRISLLTSLFSVICSISAAQTPGVYVGSERIDYIAGITKELPANNSKELISITSISDSTFNLLLIRDFIVRGRKFHETKVIPVRLKKGGVFEEIAPGADSGVDGKFTEAGLILTGYGKKKKTLYQTTFVKQ